MELPDFDLSMVKYKDKAAEMVDEALEILFDAKKELNEADYLVFKKQSEELILQILDLQNNLNN